MFCYCALITVTEWQNIFLVMLCSKMIMPDKNCYEANASSGTYRYVKRSIDIIGSLLVHLSF